MVRAFFKNISTCVFRFLNSYYGYGSDLESRDYVQPFLDEEFEGDGKEFIGALYYVRAK